MAGGGYTSALITAQSLSTGKEYLPDYQRLRKSRLNFLKLPAAGFGGGKSQNLSQVPTSEDFVAKLILPPLFALI